MTSGVPTALYAASTADRRRPVSYKLCRSVQLSNVRLLVARLIEAAMIPQAATVHFIRVSATGELIAAMAATQYQQQNPMAQVWLSMVNPGRPDSRAQPWRLQPRAAPDYYTVVIDNSIHSGDTMVRVLRILAKNDIQVDVIAKLVQYDDELEAEALNTIRSVSTAAMVSACRAADLATATDG